MYRFLFVGIFFISLTLQGAPFIGPELPASEPVYAEQVYDQRGQAVAFDGINYFVVWCDNRSDTVSHQNNFIMGSRVSSEGAVLDPSGIMISPVWENTNHFSDYSECQVALAFNGTFFLAVWKQRYSGIYAARITTEGQVLDPEGFLILTAGKNPQVASDGTGFLITADNTQGIIGKRVTAEGEIPDSEGILIGAGSAAHLTFDGSTYRIAWGAGNTAKITSDGTVSTAPAPLFTGKEEVTAIACHNTTCLLSWYTETAARIRAALISTDGTLQSQPLTITETGDSYTPAPHTAAVYADGSFYLIWSDTRADNPSYKYVSSGIYAAEITATGVNLNPGGIAIRDGIDQIRQFPAVAANNSILFITWTSRLFEPSANENLYTAYYGQGIRGQLYHLTLAIPQQQEELVISSDLSWQLLPAAVFTGSEYLLIWSDMLNNWSSQKGWELTASKITKTGNASMVHTSLPEVAYHGDIMPVFVRGKKTLLLLWNRSTPAVRDTQSGTIIDTNDCLLASRLTLSGQLIDTTPVQISCSIEVLTDKEATASFNGTDFIIAWLDYRTTESPYTTNPSYYARRIPEQGTITDEQPLFLAKADSTTFPSYIAPMDLACAADTCLFVWSNRDEPMRALRFSYDLKLLGKELVISNAFSYNPLIDFDGINYLIVYGYSYLRMRPDGTILDTTVKTVPYDAETAGGAVALQFDGFNYLAIFGESDINKKSNLYGWQITPEATLLGEKLTITDTPEREAMLKSSIASAGDGTALIAYQKNRKTPYPEEMNRTDRIMYRMFYSGVAGARCEENTHCREGLDCIGSLCADPNAPDTETAADTDAALPADTTISDSDTIAAADTAEIPEAAAASDRDTTPQSYDFDYVTGSRSGCGCTILE